MHRIGSEQKSFLLWTKERFFLPTFEESKGYICSGMVFYSDQLSKFFPRGIAPWIVVVSEGVPSLLDCHGKKLVVKRLLKNSRDYKSAAIFDAEA